MSEAAELDDIELCTVCQKDEAIMPEYGSERLCWGCWAEAESEPI